MFVHCNTYLLSHSQKIAQDLGTAGAAVPAEILLGNTRVCCGGICRLIQTSNTEGLPLQGLPLDPVCSLWVERMENL